MEAETEPVSILVFLDSLLQPSRLPTDKGAAFVFQSLFFWIHFYNRRRITSIGNRFECFNPCFSGFTSTTHIGIRDRILLFAFQSLFFWIHFYNTTDDALLRFCLPMFQSLFFWIHFYNPAQMSMLLLLLLQFQSLFFWIHFYNARAGLDAR